MILVGALLVLAAFAAFYWGLTNAFRSVGKAMAALMLGVLLLGGAFGILALIGR
jgi:hypothetical protein